MPFYGVKDHLLHHKKWSFVIQKVVFYNPFDYA